MSSDPSYSAKFHDALEIIPLHVPLTHLHLCHARTHKIQPSAYSVLAFVSSAVLEKHSGLISNINHEPESCRQSNQISLCSNSSTLSTVISQFLIVNTPISPPHSLAADSFCFTENGKNQKRMLTSSYPNYPTCQHLQTHILLLACGDEISARDLHAPF